MNSATRFRNSMLGTMTPGALTLAILFALLPITASPAHAQTEAVLYDFCAKASPCTSGAGPESSPASDGSGNFYGTTTEGGSNHPEACPFGCGVVYELSPNGQGAWNETVLYNFCSVNSPIFCADGYQPIGPVIYIAGNLYGTASFGGLNLGGVVFELSPSGAGWTETVLYSFCSQMNCADGSYPTSGLIVDQAGNFYGTAGPVYELSPNGNGAWTEQVIYSVQASGSVGLVTDTSGNLYGADYSQHIFELSPNGNGGWGATDIFTFTGAKGINPTGALVLDSAGNVYGTTEYGGNSGNGTVWELSLSKKGWKEKVLHTFGGGNGFHPVGGVVLDAAGNLYGTTVGGGRGDGGTGLGVVYELVAPVGKGADKEKVLWNFNGPDGAYPASSLFQDNAGNLYGTASGGTQPAGLGVVFEVTP